MSYPTSELTPSSSTERVEKVPIQGRRAVLVIHGGAGKITRDRYSPEVQAAYRAALTRSLEAGYDVLSRGGCALDAVEAAINVLENDPLFNSAKGAVLTRDGKCELDASIMVSHPGAAGIVDGEGDETRRTMAVTMLSRVKNPITLVKKLYLAKKGMTDHALHAAPYVEKMAEELGCEMVAESYFHTEARDRQYESGFTLDNAGVMDYEAKGTVGAVALDVNGYMAVGTSTGGKGSKLPGRIGDTPLAGAGFWCEQFQVEKKKSIWASVFPFIKSKRSVTRGMGVSATGDGDYFIRYGACHDIYARMKYNGQSLESASKDVLAGLNAVGGEGGVIGLTGEGEVVMGMNCAGMFRGWIDLSEAKPRVGIFCDDRVC